MKTNFSLCFLLKISLNEFSVHSGKQREQSAQITCLKAECVFSEDGGGLRLPYKQACKN